jgi:hypothetical protein
MKRMKILDLIEINNEDQLRAEIYFNEQQQLMNQPQVYYSGVQTGPQLLTQNQSQINTMNINQLDHNQFLGLTQSPRLKPINNYQQIPNPQLLSNINQNMTGVINLNNVNNKINKQNGKILKK